MARIWRVFFDRVQHLLRRENLRHSFLQKPQKRLLRWWYGLLAVTFALFCLLKSPVQAVMSVTQGSAIKIAQAVAQPATEAQRLERAGQEQYAAEQFQEAANSFRQASQAYGVQGNLVRQAINLGNLSLTYQRLGQWTDAKQAIDTSLALLPFDSEITQSVEGQSALAQVLDIYGHLHLTEGRTEQALKTWEKTAELYGQLNDSERLANSLINQAQALRQLGLYQRSEVVLQRVAQPPSLNVLLLEELGDDPLSELERRLQTLPAEATTVNALRNLGDTLQIAGDLEQAQTLVRHSLKLAKDLDLTDGTSQASLSLGNIIQTQAIEELRARNTTPATALAQLQQETDLIETVLTWRQRETAQRFAQQFEAALSHYQNAAEGESTVAVQARLNQLKLLLVSQRWAEAATAAAEVTALLDRLPPGPTTLEAHLNLAESLMSLARGPQQSVALTKSSTQRMTAAALLATARQQAALLGNRQAESYVLGMLGSLYEQNQQYAEAEAVTIQALQTIGSSTARIAQAINDAEIIYRWQWQLGRIHKAQGKPEDAISDYTNAVETLTQLRQDIVTSNLPYRFSFRNTVEEPVYFEFIDLLLSEENPGQENLNRSRQIISLLNQAELTNFLQEPCEVVTPQQTDQIVDNTAQETAIFYPIILPDRLEVILKLPQDPTLVHYRHRLAKDDLIKLIETLQKDLEEDYTYKAVQANAQTLYEWIVAPAQARLNQEKINTCVFALTGALQKIPMAVLYDGEHYLIQQYAIAEILGLQLDNPTALERENVNILAAGLAEVPDALPEDIRANFAPIPNVISELEVIGTSPMAVRTITDQNFTQQNFNALMNAEEFSTVHLATHGQFSSNPQETFLLTAPSGNNNGKIAASDLALLFRVRGRIRPEQIELLVLSACETAAGDELATLGIAGTAYRAGARSVIASLWTLDDAPTVSFAETFYENLGQPDVSKAEALRRAQMALLENPRFEHPRYWSTYILTGNWL